MAEDVGRRTLIAGGLALGAVPTLGGTATAAQTSAQPGTHTGTLIGPARGDRLHVMTFNVRVPVDAPPHSWADRRPLIRKLLRRESPTLLGTQEGIFGQLQDILDDLGPAYDWIHLFREGGSNGESMAVMYDQRRLKPLAYDHLWLSDTPRLIGSRSWGNNVVRMLTWVRFQDRKTGKSFVHLNTHFDHQSEPSRQRSAEMVRDTLAGLRTQFGGEPVVVTGDFNTPAETSRSYQILVTEGDLADSWSVAEDRLTKAYKTFNGWNPVPVEGGDRIDWVLAAPGVTVEQAAINTWAPDGNPPSDHWAVQSLLRLP